MATPASTVPGVLITACLCLLIGACDPGGADPQGTDTRTSAPGTSDPEADAEATGSAESSESTGDMTEGTASSGSTTDDTLVCELETPRAVDILFMIDNSWSMGEEQPVLAQAFGGMLEQLGRAEIDYRIALISSDNGHENCRSESGIGGKFRLESCLDRSDEFTDPGGQVSRFNTGCQSICSLSDEEIEILPSEVEGDDKLRARPWLENTGGRSNLADGVDIETALACFVPLGINGCGYEEQLESTYRALERSNDASEPEFGFLRDDAILAIVFFTDEIDCSHNSDNPESAEIFDFSNKVFWSDKDIGPTSSICWNAGVECEGEQDGDYEHCQATDFHVSGQPVTGDQSPVLHSLSRYTAYLDRLLAEKHEQLPGARHVISLFAGAESRGIVSYPATKDSDVVAQFGSDPGCVGQSMVLDEVDPSTGEVVEGHISAFQSATPPVRLLELVAHSGAPADESVFSICRPGAFDDALTRVGKRIVHAVEQRCQP